MVRKPSACGRVAGWSGVVEQKGLQRLLFSLEPERAHAVVLRALAGAERLPGGLARLERRCRVADPALRVTALGLEFPSPVGLAAGFDKNGRVPRALGALGFGAVEIGGVTALQRAGNPRPRVRRLLEERAIVNWMGLPNEGAAAVARRLARASPAGARRRFPLGLNVAGESVEGYLAVLRECAPLVDYVTLNVSCPYVPAAQQLVEPAEIRALLRAVREEPELRARPALLKISPDLSDEEVAALAGLALDEGAAGIVATNTSARLSGERGGLSGPPLRARATEVVRVVRRFAGDRLTISGVGGIASAADAFERIRAGASLVQVYTGFVYGGAGFARVLNLGLLELLRRHGFGSVREAVGTESGREREAVTVS